MPPLIMGHEFCGVVEDAGPSVRSTAQGQRVVSHSLYGCGECVRCNRGDAHLCAQRQLFGMNRPGGFAEYVTVPEKCVIDWPNHLSAEAASLAEPLANGVHVVGFTQNLNPSLVVVIGAGPIGLLCQQAFQRLTSADVAVADLIPDRLAVAERLGAKQVINSSEEDFVSRVSALTAGEGADVIVDAVGTGLSKKQSLKALRSGGTAVWIGTHGNTVEIDSYDITLAERRVQGTYAASLDELKIAVELLASGKVDGVSWVKKFPLVKGVDAFHRMLRADGDDIKAVLLPGE